MFQNFQDIPHVPSHKLGYFGGSVALADYCPYIQEFTWRSNNVVVRGSHCMYSENNPSKMITYSEKTDAFIRISNSDGFSWRTE
jgi:hypothetical protein